MSAIDPTDVIERMAARLRSQGAAHPVAGAIALAARGHMRMAPDAFAHEVGLSADLVGSAESGDVAFSELPTVVGEKVARLGADLLVLADLESSWRAEPPVRVART